jgi:hypothetical protein
MKRMGRIERHAVLSKGLEGVDKLSTPGGVQKGYVLRVDLIPLWLSGIRVASVKEDLRPKLEKIQEEAATVLWEAFQEGRLTTTSTDSDFETLLNQADDEIVQAYRIAQAVVKLARNQIVLQNQVTTNTQRIEELEATLGEPGREVTPEQASQISQAVKAVAIVYGKKTGRNEFGGVYGSCTASLGLPATSSSQPSSLRKR